MIFDQLWLDIIASEIGSVRERCGNA